MGTPFDCCDNGHRLVGMTVALRKLRGSLPNSGSCRRIDSQLREADASRFTGCVTHHCRDRTAFRTSLSNWKVKPERAAYPVPDRLKGSRLERDFATLGVEVVYVPYTQATSSSALCRTLRNIDIMANRGFTDGPPPELAHAA
jgi:hypothetical protein